MESYQQQESVLVRISEWNKKTKSLQEMWVPGVIVAYLGEINMRTGIARFEDLIAYKIVIDGNEKTVSERNIKKAEEEF